MSELHEIEARISEADLNALREMLVKCQTPFPSCMTAEQAKDRLKEINVFVYRCLGM